MTAVLRRPAPGQVWAGRTRRWRCLPSGMLAELGEDDPAAVYEVAEVWRMDGPLAPAAGLAAHLRREAHEEQCAPSCPDPDDRVAALLDQANTVQP